MRVTWISAPADVAVSATSPLRSSLDRILSIGHFKVARHVIPRPVEYGGGALTHLIGRLEHGYAARPEARLRASDPIAHLRRLYYDTIVFDPAKFIDPGADAVLRFAAVPLPPITDPYLTIDGCGKALSAKSRR